MGRSVLLLLPVQKLRVLTMAKPIIMQLGEFVSTSFMDNPYDTMISRGTIYILSYRSENRMANIGSEHRMAVCLGPARNLCWLFVSG